MFAASLLRGIFLGAITCAGLFLGACGEDKKWAKLMIKNSNGKAVEGQCPGSGNCANLRRAIAGELTVKLYGEVLPEDKRLYPNKPLGALVTRDLQLDKLVIREGQVIDGPCWIMTYGPQVLKIKGMVGGKPVDIRIDRTDYCSNSQYEIWNYLFETDPQALKLYFFAKDKDKRRNSESSSGD